MFGTLLSSIKRSAHHQNVARDTRARLRLEFLEGRDVPSNATPTVDTLSDVVNANDGVTSLREALIETNNNIPDTFNTISFDSSIAGGTITLSDALGMRGLTISERTIISGPSGSSITIQRDPETAVNYRIFDIEGTSVQLFR